MINHLRFNLQFPKFNPDSFKLSLGPGIHIIYGESGVGKSNLVRALAGLPVPGGGNFRLISKTVPDRLQVVFQNPNSQIVSSSVARELAFGIECTSNDQATIDKRYRAALKDFPLAIDLNRHPDTLSGGEQEILNLHAAVGSDPKTILIDDGFSFLAPTQKKEAVAGLQQLVHAKEAVVLWMTSDMDDCRFSSNCWQLTLADIKPITHVQPTIPAGVQRQGGLSLSVRNLNYSYGESNVITDFSYSVNDGRAIGIIGDNGSGKTTLAKLILSLIRPRDGQIQLAVDGVDRELNLGYLDQFPEVMLGSADLLQLAENMIKAGRLDQDQLARAIKSMHSYQINWKLICTKRAADISWSTLRFVLIQLLTHANYDLLILDEPSFGLGRSQRRQLTQYLQTYLEQNHLILISHDRNLVTGLCDHIIKLEAPAQSKPIEMIDDNRHS